MAGTNNTGSFLGSLPVIGGLAQGAVNFFTSKYNTDKTNKANRELAEYQYSKDLEMWNRGNEYNSPQAQMQRLSKAGLNPNLVYGQGAVGNSAGQLPKYNAPRMEYNYQPPVDIPSTLGMFQDFQIKNAQLDNLKAQREAIAASTVQKQITNEHLGTKLLYGNWLLKGRDTFQEQKIREMAIKLGWFDKYGSELLSTQLSAKQTDIAAKKLAMQKMTADTEFTRKKMDWYVTQMLGRLGIDAFNGLMKALPSNLLKGAKGINPKVNQNIPRTSTGRIDPTWLRRNGYFQH